VEINDALRGLFESIERVDWFGAVGEPIRTAVAQPLTISRVRSWPDTLRVMRTRQTDEFLTESRNLLYAESNAMSLKRMSQKDLARSFNRWVDEVHAEIEGPVNAACTRLPPDVAGEYRDTLRWLLLMASVVAYHGLSNMTNRLYASAFDLLADGHCVCGWAGEFPSGSLVVY